MASHDLAPRRRKRKERPPKLCMTAGCGAPIPRWMWLCRGCFRSLPFPRRKEIAEATQAQASERIFGLCRSAAEFIVEQREKRVEG